MSGDNVENKENQLEVNLVDQMKDILPKFYFNDLLGESWSNVLYQEFSKDYMIKLGNFLEEERKTKNILPEKDKIFDRFKLSKIEDIKVLILVDCFDFFYGIENEWFEQGIFVLPKVLTMEENNHNSHKNQGWEKFTTLVYELINLHRNGRLYFIDNTNFTDLGETFHSEKNKASEFVKKTYNIDLKW